MRPKRFPGLWYVQCKPFTYLASRLHSLQMDQNELPHEPRHLGVPSGVSKTISEPMVRLAQTMHLSCTDPNTVSKRTEMRFHMTPLPRSSIVCIQNNFRAYGMFGANLAPILSDD